MDDKKTENISIKNSFIGSQYSQMIGVTVSDSEVTLEFVYLNPRLKTEGEVVSRITMQRISAIKLADQITQTIKMHEQKKTKN